MTDNDQTRPPTNVIDFPQIGFRLAPTTVLDPAPGPDAVPAPAAPAAPGTGGRRSPLDLLNALPSPGILQPAIAPTATPAATPSTGLVPDTFRNTDPDTGVLPSAGMGALSMAAILAIAVAALRGSHTVLSTWWEQRQARHAETAELRQARAQQALERAKAAGQHEQAMQAIADKQAQQRAKNNRVPSSSEYGRKTLGNRSSGGSGGGGSRGGQSNTPAGRRNNGSGGGAGRGPAAHRNNAGRGNSNGPGSGGRNNRTPANHRLNTPKNPGGKGRDDRKKPTDKPGLRNTPASGTQQPTDRMAARQEARRERQRARLQRTAERQQGRLQERAKDRAAARDLKYDQKRKQAADKEQTKEQKKQDKAERKASGPGRTTLAAAASRQARRRLKRRRKNLAPPVLSTVKGKKKPKATKTSTVKTKTKAPKSKKKPKTGATKSGTGSGRWAKARAYARRKAASGGCFGRATPTSGSSSGTGPSAATGPTAGSTTGPSPGTRRSPFENAGQAAAGDPEYWVTSDRVPDSRAQRGEPGALTQGQPVITSTGPAALDAAPTTNPPRPGTTRPKEPIAMPPASREPDVVIAKAQNGAARTARQVVGRRMAAQHETEITLDDACDAGDDLAKKAFKIHDQADKLAHQAGRLRDAWVVLAEDCAEQHNLIGDAFTHASIRFGESMEMVRRTALEMSSASLTAAEKAETAANEINDAYRPYNTATADAGLTTPSAPAHNEV